MIGPLARRRPFNGLHASIKNDISFVKRWLNDEPTSSCSNTQQPEQPQSNTSSENYPVKSEKRRRCHVCVASIFGQPDYKKRRNLIPAMKNQCKICGKPVCAKHVLQIGPECSQ